jgi:hypothetical protein
MGAIFSRATASLQAAVALAGKRCDCPHPRIPECVCRQLCIEKQTKPMEVNGHKKTIFGTS